MKKPYFKGCRKARKSTKSGTFFLVYKQRTLVLLWSNFVYWKVYTFLIVIVGGQVYDLTRFDLVLSTL